MEEQRPRTFVIKNSVLAWAWMPFVVASACLVVASPLDQLHTNPTKPLTDNKQEETVNA